MFSTTNNKTNSNSKKIGIILLKNEILLKNVYLMKKIENTFQNLVSEWLGSINISECKINFSEIQNPGTIPDWEKSFFFKFKYVEECPFLHYVSYLEQWAKSFCGS